MSTIGQVLRKSDALQAIFPQMNRLLAVKELLDRVLPRALVVALTPVHLTQDLLVLSARNASVAVKLRQLTPTIVDALRSFGSIKQVRIRIDRTSKHNALVSNANKQTPRIVKGLNQPVLDCLAALRERISQDSPLVFVLERFLQ